MIEFLDMMKAMQANSAAFPDMEWSVNSDGVLTMRAYVGIANADLYKQATQMFAPA